MAGRQHASGKRRTKLRSLAGGEARALPYPRAVRDLSWQPGGGDLAVTLQDGRIILIDAASDRALAELPTTWFPKYQWSPDGRYLEYALPAAHGMPRLMVWDAARNRQELVAVIKESALYDGTLWSHDGTRLLASSGGSGFALGDAHFVSPTLLLMDVPRHGVRVLG